MMPSISLPFCSPKTRTGSGCKQSRCRWVPGSKWCAAHSRSLRPPPFSRSARQPTGNSHRQVRHASWPYGTRRSSEQSTISTRSVSVVAEPDMGTARRFVALAILCLLLPPCQCQAKLSTKFYDKSCPSVATVVRSVMAQAVAKEPRMGASIIRLFFHDCFVNGCDASILLDDTPTFTGEKNAGANANSVRGYEVIDAIKARVEAACKGTVSCADIVALASRDAVNLLRGPTWNVPLGRKDSRTASQSAANANLPGPGSNIASLISAFAAKGLSARDMTALSGAHTVGQARCVFFRGRIYTEPNINATFATLRRQTCPQSGGDGNLAPFDDQTPDAFDNAYYRNLVARRGLLHSDQELFNGGSQDALVRKYSGNGRMFANDFAKAMVRMGGLAPAAGTPTEVRLNCRKVN